MSKLSENESSGSPTAEIDNFSIQQMKAFLDAIKDWRNTYQFAWLHYIAKRDGKHLKIVAARIYLNFFPRAECKDIFIANDLQAGQFPIDQKISPIEDVVFRIMSPHGFEVEGHGILLLPSDELHRPSLSLPTLFHPDGLNEGNRLAVLTATSTYARTLIPQPETDWMLKGSTRPYDSFLELCTDYSLGSLNREQVMLELIAPCAVEVSARSFILGTEALIGIWTTSAADNEAVRLNYRVLSNSEVTTRNSVSGADLEWAYVDGGSKHGMCKIEVPYGAVVQCIACYGHHAHHQKWLVDPEMLQNPRNSIFSIVDPGLRLLRSYLLPETPVKGRAADDFEAAVTWMLWTLGFSPINFGLHPKTTDSFDILALNSRGDCLVIECTLGLLKAESKLSKLGARATQVRKTLENSQMRHLKVVPVMITAMTRDEVSVDVPAAQEQGIVVLTREDLEASFTEVLKFPNPDWLFNRALQSITPK